MLRSAAWPPSARHLDTARIERTTGRPGSPPTDRLTVARAVAATTPPLSAGTAGGFFGTLAAVAAAD
ncbi:hypothetical protein, partial [Curtobacterium flaccumfaciens]